MTQLTRLHSRHLKQETCRPQKGVFSPKTPFYYERARLAPYELIRVRASPGDCAAGSAGRKRGAILLSRAFESSEALAEQPAEWRAVPWSCIDAALARLSRVAALVRQHIDGVARASSAGTKSGSSARSLVLLTMLAPVTRTARFRDRLQLDDEVNSQIADGDLPTSSFSERQLVPEQACSARTERPPYGFMHSKKCRMKKIGRWHTCERDICV